MEDSQVILLLLALGSTLLAIISSIAYQMSSGSKKKVIPKVTKSEKIEPKRKPSAPFKLRQGQKITPNMLTRILESGFSTKDSNGNIYYNLKIIKGTCPSCLKQIVNTYGCANKECKEGLRDFIK